MVDKHTKETGFALLVSLIVVGVVLSVGLVILDLTIKQVRLSVTTRDSEIAFHAANAGMECARFWRRTQSGITVTGIAPAITISAGDLSGISCFGQSANDISVTPSGTAGDVAVLDVTSTYLTGDGGAYQYQYEFTWGPSGDRCTRVNKVLVVAPNGGGGAVVTASDMDLLIPGYPGTTDITCPAGSQCTIVGVRGYNQACPTGGGLFGYGVVERKVLLEF